MTHPIEHPTYLGDIRFLFTPQDQGCMEARGIDLRTYDGVRLNAQRIYFHVREGTMPPPSQGRRWPAEQVDTFYNWMRDGYPRGVALQSRLLKAASPAKRIRRNLAEMDPNGPEIAQLRKAFQGIMDRDPDHPQSYFAIAGLHWLPMPNVYCRHHENAYNPWHRIYMIQFEDALRSVAGCEDVTLPYWDITDDTLPEVLSQAPFDKYTIPRKLVALDGRTAVEANTDTRRYSPEVIIDNLNRYDVSGTIRKALGSSRWEDFNGWNADNPWVDGQPRHSGVIAAHDAGHNSCGPTMTDQDIASFDPIFWFFHSNWERLWWRWQQLYNATTLEDFKTTLLGDAFWLTDPVANELKPFKVGANETIDLRALDVDYIHPANEVLPEAKAPLVAGAIAKFGVSVPDTDALLVKVCGVDRLKIPGSFDLVLTANDEPIRHLAVFQSSTPQHCDTCRKANIFVGVFEIDRKEITGRRLAARIEMIDRSGNRSAFPLSQAGEPRISVSLQMVE